MYTNWKFQALPRPRSLECGFRPFRATESICASSCPCGCQHGSSRLWTYRLANLAALVRLKRAVLRAPGMFVRRCCKKVPAFAAEQHLHETLASSGYFSPSATGISIRSCCAISAVMTYPDRNMSSKQAPLKTCETISFAAQGVILHCDTSAVPASAISVGSCIVTVAPRKTCTVAAKGCAG